VADLNKFSKNSRKLVQISGHQNGEEGKFYTEKARKLGANLQNLFVQAIRRLRFANSFSVLGFL